MARRHKPKWNYRGPHLPTFDGPQVFSSAAIEKLCAAYDVPDHKIPALQERLEASGKISRWSAKEAKEAPSNPEVSAALKAVDDAAERLLGLLHNLDERSAEALWHADSEAMLFFHKQWVKYKEGLPYERESRFGQDASFTESADGGTIQSWMGAGAFEPSLQILRAYCQDALERTPKSPGGRPRVSEALRLWSTNIANLWQDLLGRELDQSINRGSFTMFCVDSYCEVDPEISSRQVRSAVDDEIMNRKSQRP